MQQASSLIEIWQPRYKDRVVLIAKYKVKDFNKIIFTKAKHLKDMEFGMSGKEISSYPVEDNGKIACYAVPLDVLLERKKV